MKLAITVQNGTLAGKRLDLTGGFLTVGRAANCTLVFDPNAENMVSTKHAYIETKPDGFYLVDSQSTNGTFVNGNRVQVVKLNSGDTIQFGKNGPQAKVSIETPSVQSPPVRQLQPPSASEIPQVNRAHQFQAPQFAESPANQPNLRDSVSFIGLGNAEVKPEPGQTGKYIGAAIAILAMVFLSLIVVVLVVADIGIVLAVVAAIVAFIPAMFYILPLMWLDRYDPEPPWLLASAFAWGALVSVVVSYFINTFIGIGVGAVTNPTVGQLASTVISAPIFEEGSKGIGLVLLLIFFRRYFDDILDGIIFGGVIALGFATVENVFYYGRGIAGGGITGLVLLFLLRGILSPFAHVTFTAMTGIGCGIARESHKGFVKILMPVVGYVCAVALHMLWNGMATFSIVLVRGLGLDALCPYLGMTGNLEGLCAFLISYSILQVPLFLIFVIFAFYVMRRQNKILKEMLALDAARGLFPQEHLTIATSAFKSTGWLLGSLFSGKYRARSRYLRALGKLGLSYWHIQRATAAQGQTGSFQQNPILREEVLKWKDKV